MVFDKRDNNIILIIHKYSTQHFNAFNSILILSFELVSNKIVDVIIQFFSYSLKVDINKPIKLYKVVIKG